MDTTNTHVSLTGMPRLMTAEEKAQQIQQMSAGIKKMVEERNTFFVFRTVVMSAMIETLLYMACDDILEVKDVTDEQRESLNAYRIQAIHYFDVARERFISEVNKSDDFMLDFSQRIEKKTKRKLTTFCNAVVKNAKRIGVTQHIEVVSKIAATMKLIETLNVYYNMTRQLPWYQYMKKNSPIERGLSMLDYCYKKLAKCLDILDPEMHKSPEQNAAIDKQYNDIIDMWSKGDLYLKALNYAEKEEKKNAINN